LCKAFLVEAKWFGSGKLPSAEEYLKNGIVSSGVHIVLVHIFFLLGKGLTKENVNRIDTTPSIISSPATILRLWDDLGKAEVNTFYNSLEFKSGLIVILVSECVMSSHNSSSMDRNLKIVYDFALP